MAFYELRPIEELVAPALLVAFEGWVDAGAVGTTAVAHIADGGEVVAEFDPDMLFDYRANRPTVDFVQGTMKRVAFPELTMRRKRIGDRDLLVLTGSEPDWQWKGFGRSVADLASRLGVVQHVSVGGVPAAVPHTQPTRILTTASREGLVKEDELIPEGLLRVPGAAVSIVEHFMVESGVPAVGFWAQVPHYVAGTYYSGVGALLERAARHLGIDLDVIDVLREADDQRRRLDETVASRPEAQAYIEQLENMATAQGPIPSGEEIAAEVERFLRETTGNGNPFEGEGNGDA